nr:DinB family protein [Nakamurella aerolata]
MIVADTKDWTWTIERSCPECGFDAGAVPAGDIGDAVLRLTEPWQQVLRRRDVADRPDPQVWSPLEYGAHIRDVCQIFAVRLRQLLTEDDARFTNWDQDATAEQSRYAEQDPLVVAGDIRSAAESLAVAYRGVPDRAWGRKGLRSNGSEFTVLTLGQYLLHDLAHHLVDVRAVPGTAAAH